MSLYLKWFWHLLFNKEIHRILKSWSKLLSSRNREKNIKIVRPYDKPHFVMGVQHIGSLQHRAMSVDNRPEEIVVTSIMPELLDIQQAIENGQLIEANSILQKIIKNEQSKTN